jgi:hypothetical protein
MTEGQRRRGVDPGRPARRRPGRPALRCCAGCQRAERAGNRRGCGAALLDQCDRQNDSGRPARRQRDGQHPLRPGAGVVARHARDRSKPPAEVVGRLEVAGAGREEGFAIGRWLRDLFANLFPTPSGPPRTDLLDQRSRPPHEPFAGGQHDPWGPDRRRRHRGQPPQCGGEPDGGRGASRSGRQRAAGDLTVVCLRTGLRRDGVWWRSFQPSRPTALVLTGHLGGRSAGFLPLPRATELRLPVEARRHGHRRGEPAQLHPKRTRQLYLPGDRHEPGRERFADERRNDDLLTCTATVVV